MALYLISYDIAEKDAFEYQPLWTRLAQLGAVRILYSEWITTDDTAKARAVYSELAPLIQEKDRLLVQEVTKDAYWDKLLIKDDVFNTLVSHARG